MKNWFRYAGIGLVVLGAGALAYVGAGEELAISLVGATFALVGVILAALDK